MTNEEHIDTLYIEMQQLVRYFLGISKENGFDLRITSSYRSFDEQASLYVQGRGLPGSVVTNAKPGESSHNYGLSVDVVDRKSGYNIDWKELGKIGKQSGLKWGGDWWKFIDRPHFYHPLTNKYMSFIKKWEGKFVQWIDGGNGEVYYVNKGQRHYVSPDESLEEFAKKFATGFNEENILRIPKS